MSNLAAIFQIGSLGDSVVSVPVLRSLRELLPDCDEYVLASRFDTHANVMPSSIFEMAWAPRYRVDYLGAGTRLQKLSSIARVIAKLRYYRPRYCIYLMPSDRTVNQVRRDRLFFRAAGVRELIGFRPMLDSELSPPAGTDFTRSTEAFLRFKRVWNGQAEAKFSTYAATPMLCPDSEARGFIEDWLQYHPRIAGKKLVAVCPFSNFASKSWPLSASVELVRRLEQEPDIVTVLLGGGKDREIAEGIIQAARGGINSCGDFSPAQSAALLQRCNLVVCADSGPMHMAGALGVPTVTTFSRISGQLHRWFPFGSNHTILYRDVMCAGCRKTICPVQGHPCMANISVEEVLRATLRRLRGLPVTAHPSLNRTCILNWDIFPQIELNGSNFIARRPA